MAIDRRRELQIVYRNPKRHAMPNFKTTSSTSCAEERACGNSSNSSIACALPPTMSGPSPTFCSLVRQMKTLELSDPMLLLAMREVLEKGKKVDEASAPDPSTTKGPRWGWQGHSSR